MRTVPAGGDMEREGIKRLVQVVEAGPRGLRSEILGDQEIIQL